MGRSNLDFHRVADLLSGLTLLKYFPADDGARLELAKMIAQMASTESQVEWLVARTLALCAEWPGPLVLRQIFCGKFRPADGIAAGPTEAFPLGPPSETGDPRCLAERALGAPDRLALPAGHTVTADPELDAQVRALAARLDLNRPRKLPAPRVIEVPNLDFKPVTQADIDRALVEYREKKARAELGIE